MNCEMSNTVITNFRDASGPRSSADSPFVVVLERDGTISLDDAALDGLVSGDASQSSGISVVRVGQEGRPEDATDSETEDESVPHVTLSVDGYYDDPNGIAKYDSGIEMLQSLSNETREHSLIGFQNDHCYTPLMSPSDALPTDSTSEISYHVLQQSPKPLAIPSSKKITILEQQIIPKGKKIVFNPTKTPVILKGKDVLTKPLPGLTTKLSKKLTNTTSPQVNEKLEEPPDDIAERTESSDSSTSGESVNDRDSDSDYKYARDHLSSKSKKNKTVLKGVKKVIAKNFGNIKNISKTVSKTKSTKSLIRQEIKDKILHKKSKMQLEKKANTSNLIKKQPEVPVNATAAPPKEPVKVEPKVETPKPQKVSKKEKKTPAHMTALLSDMTSLFSTPDVIRRVSTDGKQKSDKSSAVPSKDAAPTNPLEVLTDAGVSADSKDKAMSKQPVPLKTYSKPKEGVNLTEKMVKEMESIPQIDDASLAQLLQDTPVITTGPETATSLGVATTTAVNPLSSPNLGPLSPTLDLLAGLQPEEEGLTEDLLMHVAQLVESSENLQEVIDKQVLGKVDPVQSKPTTQTPPAHTALTYSQASSASKISQRSVGPRKDPIQIIRSDGRIITLPPIEAPATRSSKRKSLGPALQEQEAPVHEIPVQVPEPTLIHMNPKQYANKKLSLKKNEAPHTSGEVAKFLQESDDSLNSEDDPYRLWCICKQPHNNRFMICCDRCEDWFHGKCVNITKAMGQQMEEQGVEWTCPNCIKKFQTPKALPKPALTRRSVEGPREATRAGASPAAGMVARKVPDTGLPNCIVCEKTARAGSIYCSDACILKHAQESLGPNASSPTKADTLDKSDARVIVFERKTGRCLQGPNAPTANNLKAWLQEHPTFEVVRRERENKPMVNVKKTPARPLQKIQTTLKFDKQQKQIILVQPQAKPPQSDTKTSRSVPQSPQEDVPKTPTTPKPNVSTRPTISLKQTLLTSKEAPNTPKSYPPTPRQGPQTPKQGPPTHKQTPPTPRLTSPTPKTPTKVTLVRTPSSNEKSTRAASTPTTRRREREPEPKPKPASTAHIRESVRSALREQLTLRLAETKGVKFTDDEIKKFAINTELELHNLFKEASMKYKAKYRSLIFNIKDRKNLSLWQKICDRSLTPKQLVRMSPEELASQELAQWRDKEAKYQLELIKKSELDLLAASKTYVLKTHKGEEVMETPKPVAAELDPNVAVEDLVTALNDSTAGEEEPSLDKDNKSKHSRHKDQIRKKSPPLETRARSSSRHKSQKEEKSKTSHKKAGKDDKERKVEERRSRRDRHKSRSRDRTRDRSKQRADKKETRSKSVSKETPTSSEPAKARSRSRERSKHRSRSRERSRTRHRSRSKSKRSRSKYRSQSQERPHRSLSQENDYRSKDKYSKESELVERPKSAMQKEVHPEYDPHEPMITSAFSEEDLRRSREASFEEPYVDEPIELPSEEYDPASTLTLSIASSSRVDRIPSEAESDQEPSSTVDSSAPPVWNGLVNMVDVARFYVDAHEVSGNCTELEEELSPELDIVGRINPKSVWEYIGKMKRTGNKDILVLRLSAAAGATVEERMQYIALYSYLSSRNRLGVVKVTNTSVKDFYIFPLAANAPVPSVLLPLDRGPGLEDTRNHLLIAIIVRQRKKRHATTKPDAIPAKISKSSVRTRSYTPPVGGGESYTPPTSPTRRSAAMRLPLPFVPPTPALSSSVKDKIAASLASAEEEEPYSPGSSSGSSAGGAAGGAAAPDALRSRVDEINRQIEEQKQQILSMAATVQPSEDEAYSPSRPMTPPRAALADISLPSNLQEILATIQQRSAAPPPPPPTDVDMRVPPPPPTGHLHTLTEEELLRMVPDNAH